MFVSYGQRSGHKKTSGCEDFAAGKVWEIDNQKIAYAAVSDGCGSSPNSRFGAQLTCFLQQKFFETELSEYGTDGWGAEGFWDALHLDSIFESVIEKRAYLENDLGFAAKDGLSTSLSLLASPTSIHCGIVGDGGFFYKQNGLWKGKYYSFSNNAPAYPDYWTAGGYQQMVTGGRPAFVDVTDFCEVSGVQVTRDPVVVETDSEKQGYFFSIPREGVEIALVCSDGLGEMLRYEDGEETVAPLSEIVSNLFKFPLQNETVVSRVLRGFIGKERGGVEYFNVDDLSISAIFFDNNEN